MGLLQIIHIVFSIYTVLLIANIFLSWFPDFHEHAIAKLIRAMTEPYLAIFRKFIPLLGPIDLSPIIAFFFLSILEACIRGLFIR